MNSNKRKLDAAEQEKLLRRLDDSLSGTEREEIDELLRNSPAAREFLCDLAEQAVVIADVERARMSLAGTMPSTGVSTSYPGGWQSLWNRSTSLYLVVTTLLLTLVAVTAFAILPIRKSPMAHISKLTGSNHYFGASGKIDNTLSVNDVVNAGDTLETRSCDAWIELQTNEGPTITIAGHSTLRVLQPEVDEHRIELVAGSLWLSPSERSHKSIVIQTPCAFVESRNAQLDVQTSPTQTVVRVNQGNAHVASADGSPLVDVTSDHQVAIDLGSNAPPHVIPQPKPVNAWNGQLRTAPEISLGNWLPPSAEANARLGAVPLRWPLGNGEQIMLYALGFAAWKSSDHPVLLHTDSCLRFRGRTQIAHVVRFGFSAQKMQGVFAGKFEIDLEPTDLGPSGETWQVELPLARFHPLHPQLAASPEGLELTDVYALTVETDAGLEIHDVELVPRTMAP